MAQIFLNFVTGYEERGQRDTVMDLKKIRRNYLRGFFLIDLLSILPINYVEQIVRQGGSATGEAGRVGGEQAPPSVVEILVEAEKDGRGGKPHAQATEPGRGATGGSDGGISASREPVGILVQR